MKQKLNDINRQLHKEKSDYIKSVDENYENQIKMIAESVFSTRYEKPVILLTGPSGSGKTTTAHKLEAYLDSMGCETHTISLDNYFKTLTDEEKLLAEEGNFDFESTERLDIDYLSTQLENIINCVSVDIPHYDFIKSARVYSGLSLTRKPGELIILEGIHALNPDVIRVADKSTVKIYISVRTRIESDTLILHPSKIRLLRRMIRDRTNRGRSLTDTIRNYVNVEVGEAKYIMPYKHRADFDIDTFIAYEIGVYKGIITGDLRPLADEPLLWDLLNVLCEVDTVKMSEVSDSALIREFIS